MCNDDLLTRAESRVPSDIRMLINQFLIKEICCVNNQDKYNPLYEETNKTHN